MSALALHTALAAALIESAGLAILILLRAGGVPGMPFMVTFLFGVAAWIGSCELPNWLGPRTIPLAQDLVALSPLTSAVFLHFVLVLCRAPRSRLVLGAIYAVAGATTLCALIFRPGDFEPWLGLDYFFMPNAAGWAVGAVWAALAVAGHGVMFVSWLRLTGQARRQVTAMCLASGWGSLCMAGYGFPPLGIDFYPYPLLLLPAYPVILVYGILRYQLMIVNAWARRALAWTLLVGLGSAVVIGIAALPLPFGEPTSGWRLWAVAVATLLASGLLLDPFRRLATRIVYPGSFLPDDAAERWRRTLAGADSYAALAARAEAEISAWLRMPIAVSVAAGGSAPVAGSPRLVCARDARGWHSEPAGWEAAPPGPRHAAQLFGAVLAEAAQRLEQALALAELERERQRQARLAELGALAATVAHDIRNPLNIIAMAAAAAPPDARQEIAVQTTRISRLASDLLDYAKPWQLDLRPLNLADHLRVIAARYPQTEIAFPPSAVLAIDGDARRLTQAFTNLLDNARAARTGEDTRVGLEALESGDGGVVVHVCDNGAGIPPDIWDTLFQPFVSRSPDGTGLGLAIVAKIVEAHGASIRLSERPGWRTCFTVRFPPPSGVLPASPQTPALAAVEAS